MELQLSLASILVGGGVGLLGKMQPVSCLEHDAGKGWNALAKGPKTGTDLDHTLIC